MPLLSPPFVADTAVIVRVRLRDVTSHAYAFWLPESNAGQTRLPPDGSVSGENDKGTNGARKRAKKTQKKIALT